MRGKTGRRTQGSVGRGHAPRCARGGGPGRTWQAPGCGDLADDREGLRGTPLVGGEEFGPVRCAGVEGTSSYGAGVARHLKSRGIEVLEVERPKRRQRSTSRRNGKSDHTDAEAAARIVLAGEAAGVPTQERRRRGGDDPRLEGGSSRGREGEDPSRQPAQEPSGDSGT
jgi:hypothetical protein